MLEELFSKYKELTINIISCINVDTSVDELMEKREDIINEISSLTISGEDKKKAYLNLGLEALDKELENLLKEKITKIKEDMKKNVDSKKIYSGYVARNISGSFIRKTI